ncbi:long-chain-fatty-acid--CoA ligase [Tardiphaga sp.]|jgi:fatty-acyl-CoA synthase|uniref:long-chain-fatty-acid--CoA ligase n=1 Tax=Tardiphaga sp. TaxID=1926292 RepID=UPI0037D9D0FE
MIKSRPFSFVAPNVPLDRNLTFAAERYAEQPAVHFGGRTLSFREVDDEVNKLCGWLQKKAGLRQGDRVALFMQNSPQWLISFYATLRAGGVVVPVSPMNRASELTHYLRDSGASVLIVAGDLLATAKEVADAAGVAHVLVVSYADYLDTESASGLPAWLTTAHAAVNGSVTWREALDLELAHDALRIDPDDICALPYTSGSTGGPKACIHTHRSLMHTAAGMTYWHGLLPGDVALGAAPMYHVSGLCHAVTSPIFAGAAIAIIPRWDRTMVIEAIEKYGVTHASLPPTAIIDLLSAPDIAERKLSTIRRVSSGGAAMPEAVWARLKELLGVTFLEAYGMTETAATTHLNPPEAPRARCLGIPFFGTRSLIVDPETLEEVPVGEAGEIVICGPQLFQGYWNRSEDTEKAFITVGGRRYLRSGDIGYTDNDGYFYMTDRAKRMINASGLKVWPTEVESVLYAHPGVLEACVVATPDSYRGETVKGLIVRRADSEAALTESGLIAWCRERMAAYKYPRVIEFVDALPKSPAGKILWKELQDKEMNRETRDGR